MEKSVLGLFSENILEEAARRFGIEPGNLQPISDVENFVYKHEPGTVACVLRITHNSHRTLKEIKAELEWMEYLSTHAVRVARPIHSVNGLLIEGIGTDRSCFMATAFKKISGMTILDARECTPEIFTQWGRIMGRMHVLAKKYKPRLPSCRRRDWDAEDLVVNAVKYIPGQKTVLERLSSLMDELDKFPRDRNYYGLIHADLTDVNFFVHDHQITVFDFDDCQYHWFAYDIATVLHDLPWLPRGEMDETEFTRYFWSSFYKGYTEENDLDPFWIKQLVNFVKLREINLFVAYHKKWASGVLSEKRRAFLSEMRKHIEQGSISSTLADLTG